MAEINIKIGQSGAEITDAAVKRVTKSVKQLQEMTAKQFSVGFKAPTGMGGLFDVGATGMRNLARDAKKAGDEVKSTTAHFSLFGRIVAASALITAAQRVTALTDAFINLQSKLGTVGNEHGQVEQATERLAGVARRARSDIESLATVYTRTTRAMTGYGKTSGEVTRFTETLSKAIKIGGSTNVEAANAMIQLSQGMSSGTLRGDELRSVMEQLPVVAGLIAKEFGVTTGELKQLGAQGKLTTDRVFGAIIKASLDIDEKFKVMRLTVADGWTALKNSALLAAEKFTEANGKIANAMIFLADHFDLVTAAAEALAYQIGIILAVRTTQALISGLAALAAVNPFLALAVGATAAIAAIAPFADKIDLAKGGLVTLKDVFTVLHNEVKAGFTTIGNLLDDILPKWSAFFDPTNFEATLMALREISQSLFPSFAPFFDGALAVFDKAKTEGAKRRLAEAQHGLIQDIVKRDQAIRDLEAVGTEPITRKPPPPKAVGGKTAEDIIRELREGLAVLRTPQGEVEMNVQKRLEQVLDGLGKKHSATAAQKAIMEDLIRQQDSITVNKKEQEEEEKLINQALDERLKKEIHLMRLEEKRRAEEIRHRREMLDEATKRAQGGIDTAVDILNPNAGTERQITELTNRRAEGQRLGTLDPEQIKTITRAINQLHLSLDALGQGTFVNEMNQMFGMNGTLAQTMASAASSAILFADSWRDVKDIVNDVINQITHQLLTSLIKLGINAALGGSGVSQTPFQFASGGYTGNMATNQVAGIVHGREFVVNAAATSQFRPQLEAMNKGQAPGIVKVDVHNNAPGVDVQQQTSSAGDIQIMINKAIAAQVPKHVAAHINDPSSKVSKTLQKNLESGRRRL